MFYFFWFMHTSTQYLIIRRCYNSFRLSKYECPALDYKCYVEVSSNSGLTHTSVTFNNVAGGHRWIALIFRINDCFPYLSSHCHMTWYCPCRWCLCVFLSSSIRPSCASCSSCWGDSLIAVVWNAARKGLEPCSEFRLQHGLSWM